MSQRARISLSGTDPAKVDSVCAQIKGISQRTGVDIALRQLMRIQVPDGVNIEIVLRSA